MFTNWLTSPTSVSNTTATALASNSSSSSVSNEAIQSAQSSLPSSAHLIGQLSTNLMTTPPDVILEVGQSPTIRFVAHSSLLAMHSGYLRSAIRIDENFINGNNGFNNNSTSSNRNNGLMEFPPIYLTNVTPEQFGPLLTYMYTGYLDLTLENIFGVLLATHVLHMPRALEICRAFLAHSQAEGYLNGVFLSQSENSNNLNHNNNNSLKSMNGCKIIRPIASKPILPNLGFIVPPQIQNISLSSSTTTSFRSLNNNSNIHSSIDQNHSLLQQQQLDHDSKLNRRASSPENLIQLRNSSSPHNSSVLSEKNSKSSSKDNLPVKRSPKLKRISEKHRTKTPTTIISPRKDNITSSVSTQQQQQHNLTGTNQNHDNENKVIIDVASCDGPVRFRRVLNDSYGRQPDSVHLPTPQHERSHQSVSYSFHQQMAKNICQQRQQQQQQLNNLHHHSEESENSEDLRNGQTNAANSSASGEVFNCVYCKHTFKSQYCYQKHAKRHLNPLSLEHGEGIILAPTSSTFCEQLSNGEKINLKSTIQGSHHSQSSDDNDFSNNNTAKASTNNKISKSLTRTINNGNSITKSSGSCAANNTTITTTTTTSTAISSDNKREVRPLDMNVQYYPCKTCGSKFPSYYFVHKHRKMCHANEEN